MYEALERTSEAEHEYRMVLRLDPDNEEAGSGLQRLLETGQANYMIAASGRIRLNGGPPWTAAERMRLRGDPFMSGGRWHALSADRVLEALGADGRTGLAADDVTRRTLSLRTESDGRARAAVSPVALLLKQFQDFMVAGVLGRRGTVGACWASGWMRAAIAVIVVLNGLLGFMQEYRGRAFPGGAASYRRRPRRVVRDGGETVVPAAEVVPGDLVLLFDGDRVPADGRLVEAHALAVDESVLTGESTPVSKNAAAVHRRITPPGDRTNMLFKGTAVTRGRAVVVVTETGMDTEMGRIAGVDAGGGAAADAAAGSAGPAGPVAGSWAVSPSSAAVFALGVSRGFPVYKMFLTAVSLAVAAIPEGLPAVVTISLALGVQQMLRKRAVVRRLPAVETLGCATVICSDKTGTLNPQRDDGHPPVDAALRS